MRFNLFQSTLRSQVEIIFPPVLFGSVKLLIECLLIEKDIMTFVSIDLVKHSNELDII